MKRTTQDLGPTKTETLEPGNAAIKSNSDGISGKNARTTATSKTGGSTKSSALPNAKTVTNLGEGKSNGAHSNGQAAKKNQENWRSDVRRLRTMRDGDFSGEATRGMDRFAGKDCGHV